MITAIWIGLWAWLFTGPLSEADKLFGWLKSIVFLSCPKWLFYPLIGCAACHAGQVALWYSVYKYAKTGEFSIPFIISAIFAAILFEDFEAIREKWKTQ